MNPIKRRILIVLFSLGAVGGFASGIHSLHRAHACHRESFERHVAQICVDAAKGVPTPQAAPPPNG